MEYVTVKFVDSPEDGGLKQTVFVFDHEEVDRLPGAGRGSLQALKKPRDPGPGAMGKVPRLPAWGDAQIPEGLAVGRERMSPDVQPQGLPLHALFLPGGGREVCFFQRCR